MESLKIASRSNNIKNKSALISMEYKSNMDDLLNKKQKMDKLDRLMLKN